MVWVCVSIKMHGLGEICAAVSDVADADTDVGWPMVTTGFLGLGKLISTYRSVGSDVVILGEAPTGDILSIGSSDCNSIWSWCDVAGPAP